MGLKLLAATAALTMVVAAVKAEAAVVAGAVIDITQVGSNVVITGSGTLDLTGLTKEFSTFAPTEVVPSLNTVLIGTADGAVDVYSGITSSPASLGPGPGTTAASSGSGETFGINDMVLDVPAGYISGESLSGSSTFDNTTIAQLGFTPGTYVFSWDSDPITIEVSSAVPEPSTWAMMLLGFAGLGYVGYRQRHKLAGATIV